MDYLFFNVQLDYTIDEIKREIDKMKRRHEC